MRDRASFRALARGRRRVAGGLEMKTAAVGSAVEPPRVAFGIGRNVGNAVTRNRIRRRLRAAVRANVSRLEPGHAYLWKATPSATEATFRELTDAVRATLRHSPERSGP